jgi:hypothetical protein
LVREGDEKCDEILISNRVIVFKQTLGLLDAAFGCLSILYSTDDGKKHERQFKPCQSNGEKLD